MYQKEPERYTDCACVSSSCKNCIHHWNLRGVWEWGKLARYICWKVRLILSKYYDFWALILPKVGQFLLLVGGRGNRVFISVIVGINNEPSYYTHVLRQNWFTAFQHQGVGWHAAILFGQLVICTSERSVYMYDDWVIIIIMVEWAWCLCLRLRSGMGSRTSYIHSITIWKLKDLHARSKEVDQLLACCAINPEYYMCYTECDEDEQHNEN